MNTKNMITMLKKQNADDFFELSKSRLI